MATTFDKEAKQRGEVKFVTGGSVQYPKWLLYTRGKDLLKLYYQVFNGKFINLKKLLDVYKRLPVVPSDLLELMIKLQGKYSTQSTN